MAMPWYLHGSWDLKSKSHAYVAKHVTHWAISPGPGVLKAREEVTFSICGSADVDLLLAPPSVMLPPCWSPPKSFCLFGTFTTCLINLLGLPLKQVTCYRRSSDLSIALHGDYVSQCSILYFMKTQKSPSEAPSKEVINVKGDGKAHPLIWWPSVTVCSYQTLPHTPRICTTTIFQWKKECHAFMEQSYLYQ